MEQTGRIKGSGISDHMNKAMKDLQEIDERKSTKSTTKKRKKKRKRSSSQTPCFQNKRRKRDSNAPLKRQLSERERKIVVCRYGGQPCKHIQEMQWKTYQSHIKRIHKAQKEEYNSTKHYRQVGMLDYNGKRIKDKQCVTNWLSPSPKPLILTAVQGAKRRKKRDEDSNNHEEKQQSSESNHMEAYLDNSKNMDGYLNILMQSMQSIAKNQAFMMQQMQFQMNEIQNVKSDQVKMRERIDKMQIKLSSIEDKRDSTKSK